MFRYLMSFIWPEEKNSLCPNSLAPMPHGKFHNYAITRVETDGS